MCHCSIVDIQFTVTSIDERVLILCPEHRLNQYSLTSERVLSKKVFYVTAYVQRS
jgi:hypothetical protein